MITANLTRSIPGYQRFTWWHAALFLVVMYAPSLAISWRDELFPGFLVPPLRPPGYMFPIIWPILNFCTLWAGLRILNTPSLPRRSLHVILQASFWIIFAIFPFAFFALSSPILGAILTLLIFAIALSEVLLLWTKDRKTAQLMVPLMLWGAFAGLYLSIWQALYNPDPFFGTGALFTLAA